MAEHVRVATVGHVEWIDFLHVPHLPAAGEIVEAGESWSEAGGGRLSCMLAARAALLPSAAACAESAPTVVGGEITNSSHTRYGW